MVSALQGNTFLTRYSLGFWFAKYDIKYICLYIY